MKKTTTEKTSDQAAKPARVTLTKAQRVAAYQAAGGRCYVLGEQLDPLGEWHVELETNDDGTVGHYVLLSPAAKKLKGGRTLEELRGHVADKITACRDAVAIAQKELHEAECRYDAAAMTLGGLVQADGAVVFAGEARG